MKKIVIIFIVYILGGKSAFCQSSSINLDSIFLTTRNLMGMSEVIPQPNDYTSQVELNVAFYISDTTQLDSVEVRYGTSSGKADILDLSLKFMYVDQKPYLVVNGMKYPVYGNYRVYITYLIPEYTLQNGADYVWVRAKDEQGKYSNILTDIN